MNSLVSWLSQPLLLPLLGAVVLILLYCLSAIRIVPEHQVYVVERFRRFAACRTSGFTLLFWGVHRVVGRFDLAETLVNVPELKVLNKDGVEVQVAGEIYYRVLEPEAAHYQVAQYQQALKRLCASTLRSCVGRVRVEGLLEGRHHINVDMVAQLNAVTKSWGIVVARFELQEVKLPAQVTQAYQARLAAEQVKRADILASEAALEVTRNQAEGYKRQQEAEAEAAQNKVLLAAQTQAKVAHLTAQADEPKEPLVAAEAIVVTAPRNSDSIQ